MIFIINNQGTYLFVKEFFFLGVFVFLFFGNATQAQTDTLNLPTFQLSNLRTKSFQLKKSFQQLDSLTILSAKLIDKQGSEIPNDQYEIKNDSIRAITDAAATTLNIHYRVAPDNWGAHYSHFDSTYVISTNDGVWSAFQYDVYAEQKANIVDFKGLNYRGNFSRGISFGNTQNLVLNSNFNLQMAGEIGDGIEILAAITDENIPLQPEGNTQQLSEFDKIFIQLKKGKSQLIAGDYELLRPKSYFMNYLKKLQGITFSNEMNVFEKKGILKNKASVAVARGKFARNTLEVQESNQGPYKLQGASGERFIIILSGTEKIYWDGQLLVRGATNDYVIDYNQGTVTFTQNRLVTKDTRIIAEYDYSDRNYLRSIAVLNTEMNSKRSRIYFNAYTEQDSKSLSNTDLNQKEVNALRTAGDIRNNVFLEPAIDTIKGNFDEFRVQYELRDTSFVCNGVLYADTALVYTTDADALLYSATFVEVALGEGDYIRCDTCAANGDVFTYVVPIDCQSQGNYRSARRLIPPEQRQLFTAGLEYKITKNGLLSTELALSNDDPNRFSNIDNNQNQGLAAYIGWEQKIKLKPDSTGWSLLTNVDYEYKQSTFSPLNPYRATEFKRDWNIPQNEEKVNEQIGKAGLTLKKKDLGEVGYLFSSFLRDVQYTGTKHRSHFNINKKGWLIEANASLLQSNGQLETTRFLRPNVLISKTFKKLKDWKIGYQYEHEKNQRYYNNQVNTDTLNLDSYAFTKQRYFLESPQSDKFNIQLSYTNRVDNAPVAADFSQATEAKEFSIRGNWRQARQANLAYNFTYRNLEISDSLITARSPQTINAKQADTYLGRADYNVAAWKGAVQSNTGYEIGSGQEQKINFQYIKVNAGEGNFQWRDYNDDGVVQVNEIENFVFQDSANVQRVVIYTDEFIRVNTVNFNQSLLVNPRMLWFKEKGFKGFLARWSTKSTLQILRKVRVNDEVSPYNPFELQVADTSLVATNAIINNSVFFNRSSQKFGAQYTRSDRQRKRVLTSGFESTAIQENTLILRQNISRKIGLKVKGILGSRSQDSELFDNKDYAIEYMGVEPRLTWQPNNSFNIVGAFKWQDNENTLLTSNNERAIFRDYNIEMAIKQATKSTIRLKANYVQIDFTGEANTPVGFAMLQGLQPGKNYLWTITLDRQLSKSLRMSLSYEGRKTGLAPLAHVGRAQVAAVF